MALSARHAGLVLLFQNRPTLALELLQGVFGLARGAAEPARVEGADLTEPIPSELRADHVVSYLGGELPLAVVVEVQLDRDPEKRFTWPAYAALVRARSKLDVCLLVVAPEPAVARWCERPIALGNGAIFTPVVLSADQIPVVTDPATARADPELSVLSALAHGRKTAPAVALATAAASALTALDAVDPERAMIYFDLVRTGLGEAARKAFDAMISKGYEFQSDFALRYLAEGRAKGRAEGEAEGEAKAVLAFLEARGLTPTPEERARILACTNLDTLDQWVRRAVGVQRAGELFD